MPLSLRTFRILAIGLLLGHFGNAHPDTYIRAGAIVDVEAGELVENRTIAIEEGVIVAIVPAGSAPVPPDGVFIDLSDYTVLPGLIDAHTHLLYDSDDHGLNSLVVSLPEATINGVRNAAITLQAAERACGRQRPAKTIPELLDIRLAVL